MWQEMMFCTSNYTGRLTLPCCLAYQDISQDKKIEKSKIDIGIVPFLDKHL
jgi:hypothetical protein